MSWTNRLCAVLMCSAVLAAAPAHAATSCQKVSPADIAKFLATSKAKPHSKVSSFKLVTRITHEGDNDVDFFTQPSNRAHPSFVRRSVAFDNSDVVIKTAGYTAGSDFQCDRWMKAFTDQDAKIKARFKISQSPATASAAGNPK